MPVVNPKSWEFLQFGDETALIDFYGTHMLFHRALDVKVRSLGGAAYNYPPIGDGGGDNWLLALQQAHSGAASALLIAPPPDLTTYDLNDPDEFATFFFLLAQDDIRLRQAAGI